MPTTHKIKRVPFKDWTPYKLETTLNYCRVRSHSLLTDWISVKTDQQTIPFWDYIQFIQKEFFYNQTVWNELELYGNFIAPFLLTVSFRGKFYNYFSGRSLSAVYGEVELYGETDWMVAFGGDEPQTPFFFIHEYKRTKGSESDPLGQLLAAMIAAQHLNQNNKPLYGAYILGNIWYFVVLVDKTYAVSTAYDALDADELTQIWLILHKRKLAIEAEVETLVKNKTMIIP